MVLFFQPRYLEKKGIVVNSKKIKDISLYIYAPTDTFTQVDKFHRREPRYDAERFPTAAFFSVFPLEQGYRMFSIKVVNFCKLALSHNTLITLKTNCAFCPIFRKITPLLNLTRKASCRLEKLRVKAELNCVIQKS